MKSLAVFWDIDGTLLTTARAGIGALEQAARAVLGEDVALADMKTAGLTDPMIAAAIVERVAGERDAGLARQLLSVYTDALPKRLGDRQGEVLPGVADVLDALTSSSDIVVALLTGNMRAGATAKLSKYGLDGYFRLDGHEGGFGDDGESRVDIARVAVRRLEEREPSVAPERRFLVGDTPLDIECGLAAGLKPIAVATGGYCLDELLRCGPWCSFDRLPPATDFLRLIGATDA